MHPRLSLNTIDIHILLKLKKGGNLSQEEFQAIIKNNRIECAVEILAVSNNAMQWEFFKTNWEKYLEDDSIEYYEKEINLLKFVECLTRWFVFPGLQNAPRILQPYLDGNKSKKITVVLYFPSVKQILR